MWPFNRFRRHRQATLTADWVGKWDTAILSQYLSAPEQQQYLRLQQSRRWKFSGVPSVRKQGMTIELTGQGVDDQQLKLISDLRNLHVLVLQDCPVTDAGMAQLASIDSLECLVVSGTKVTEHGLTALRFLPKLKRIDVDRTQISADGIAGAGLKATPFSLKEVEKKVGAESQEIPPDVARETAEIALTNRRLAAMRPETCLPDLALSLNNLGWGRRDDFGVRILTESIAMTRQLMQSNHGNYTGMLFTSLANLANAQEAAGHDAAALQSISEAIELSETHGPEQTGSLQDFALALQKQSQLSRKLKDDAAAVAACRKATAVYRQLCSVHPTAAMLHSWFATSLTELSELLLLAGHSAAEACQASEEAIAVCRQFDSNPMIATCYRQARAQLVQALRKAGRTEEATVVEQELTPGEESP